MMDADGKNQKQLTSDAGLNTFPSASPDGRYIVFCSSRASTSGAFNVWRMDVDGANPKQLTKGQSDLWPVASPDGKWVVYTSLVDSGKPTLWKVSMDGGEPIRLTDKTSFLGTISPDGKYIACRSSNPALGPMPKVAILPFDGGEPIKWLDVSSEFFRWAPNGRAILYLDNRGGVANIWSQPLDGSKPKQVTDFKSDPVYNFDWSRDGKQLAVLRGIGTKDIVMISNVAESR
jgi:TolB protein